LSAQKPFAGTAQKIVKINNDIIGNSIFHYFYELQK